MTDDRCECCDLPLASCGLAVERARAAERRAAERRAPGREAEWAGVCAYCFTHFPAGAMIRWYNEAEADGTAGWGHSVCPV